VYVTPEAQRSLRDSAIWFHLGGFSEDGDTYDTQEHCFTTELDAFWLRLWGPEEPIRSKLVECLHDLPAGWQSVTIQPDGSVRILQRDGGQKVLLPPNAAQAGEEVAT
jgi:hypothetical protein